MQEKNILFAAISWVFGIVFLLAGLINIFWGDDSGFGVFIVLLSFIYFPPVTNLLKKKTNRSIPRWAKIALGVFIIWALLGVGELMDKVSMMVMHFLPFRL